MHVIVLSQLRLQFFQTKFNHDWQWLSLLFYKNLNGVLFSICFQAEEKSFSATERISNLHQQIEDIQAELNRVSFTMIYLQYTYMMKMNVCH